MTARHFHPLRGARGLASVEHEHEGPERRHVHRGDPNLLPSMAEDPMAAMLERRARAAGRPLPRPINPRAD